MYIGAMKLVLNAAAVVSAGTVYSNSFNIGYGVYFGVRVLASSASGTPSVQIQVEESSVLPATENASDTNYVVPDGLADVFSNLNDEVYHVKAFSPVPMAYGRFKITGLGSNPADTLLTIQVFIQEPGRAC